MINFTVGPVQSSEGVREIGFENTPYFRTPEFSEIMLENEAMIKSFAKAPEGSRVAFITGSSTASMEASIMNTLNQEDKAIVVNGGGFGERFQLMLELHGIPHDPIILKHGKTLTSEDLAPFDGKGYTAFLVNMCETSTGVLYDMDMIGDFCKRNGIFLIVDAVSAFIADEFDMERFGASVMITGSQKALAVPPGVSLIILDKKAQERVAKNETKCMYLDLKAALKDGERGQTPFTPAVTTLLQINKRLKEIEEKGGIEAEGKNISDLAEYFRSKVAEFPFDFFADKQSNCVTSLQVSNNSAKEIFSVLKDEYGIWICPNGGDLADAVFRVGHLGDLDYKDYDVLLEALSALKDRGIISE